MDIAGKVHQKASLWTIMLLNRPWNKWPERKCRLLKSTGISQCHHCMLWENLARLVRNGDDSDCSPKNIGKNIKFVTINHFAEYIQEPQAIPVIIKMSLRSFPLVNIWYSPPSYSIDYALPITASLQRKLLCIKFFNHYTRCDLG